MYMGDAQTCETHNCKPLSDGISKLLVQVSAADWAERPDLVQ